eukprot:TRINITY_DN3507_c0_g1_i7.p1 TRINITY_DN3507_c0_g1~~TRINITY_DN3507_c0_g1_i7.p1  ORF type:complete len:116 (+),score=26.02 TRINITY_DN3507_c0_g1_i7:28-348(+)
MIRRPPRSTLDRSSAASDVYKRQVYSNRKFRLADMDSKFGTLVLLHGKQELHKEKNLSVQVGNRIITLGIKDKSKVATHCKAHAGKLLLEGEARNDNENREEKSAT